MARPRLGFDIVEIESGKDLVCAEILGGLREWFGYPGAVDGYVRGTRKLLTWVSRVDQSAVGLLSLKNHGTFSAEIHLLAIKKEWHRQGMGRALVERAESHARNAGLPFLTLKTVSDDDPSPDYARTRAFYEAMGFRPLEVFKTLFPSGDPCLLMVKVLRAE